MATDARIALAATGERLALEHLQRLGYRLLEANHRTRWGELDLIAFDGTTLAFCEVKTRRQGTGTPWDALRATKQRQVRRMAASWLAEVADRPRAPELRFDAIGITVDPRGRLASLDHLEGAF